MPGIPVKGDIIHYISGDILKKERPTVLMVHGAGQNSFTWRYQIECLKSHPYFNLVIPDLPGHNKSTGNGCRTIEEYSSFLKDFVDTLDLGDLILIGHSMGGGIVQVFTLKWPHRVCALVLVGTGSRLRVARETLWSVENDFETFCRVAPTRAFSGSAPKELKEAFVETILKTPQSVIHQDLLACDDFDITEGISSIEVPTLIISADEDILTPVKYGEYLHGKIKGSRFYVIRGAGHFMMQEKPEEFNRILMDFLGSLSLKHPAEG